MTAQLRVLLVAILPIVELKGAIPIGVAQGLNVTESTLLGILGTCLQIPLNLLLIGLLVRFAHRSPPMRRFLQWSQQRTQRHRAVVNRWGVVGVAILVGIPIPGTGLWTGTVAGEIIGLRGWPLVLGLVLGTVVAGILVGLATAGVATLF